MCTSIFRVLNMGALHLAALASLSQAAWVHFNPEDTSKVPKLFSQTGFYANMAAKTVTSEAAFYDVNTPLWSDNAAKMRWVILKPGASKIQFDAENDFFNYSDGTVFVKLFMHDTIPGNAASRIYWETRLLIKHTLRDTVATTPLQVDSTEIWYPFTYKWKRDGTEAYLVNQKKGLDTTLTITVNGQKRIRKWTFPSASGCNYCHRKSSYANVGRSVLGFFTPQLNRPSAANASVNQILELFNKGILGWSKPAAPTSLELGAMAKWARLDDNSQSLDLRARSYIAANCSGCHGERGIATAAAGDVKLNYDFFKVSGGVLTPAMELRLVATGPWGLQPLVSEKGETLSPKLIVPGYPQLSTILQRMKARNQSLPTGTPEDTAYKVLEAQMPPLGVFEVDTAAIQVVTQWITQLSSLASIHKWVGEGFVKVPTLHGERVVLQGGHGKVLLVGVNGMQHELMGISGNEFRIPKGLPAGIYLLKVGGETFKLAL
jgi:hypothetical protein